MFSFALGTRRISDFFEDVFRQLFYQGKQLGTNSNSFTSRGNKVDLMGYDGFYTDGFYEGIRAPKGTFNKITAGFGSYPAPT